MIRQFGAAVVFANGQTDVYIDPSGSAISVRRYWPIVQPATRRKTSPGMDQG